MTFQIPLRITILLYQEERREITTRARLSMTKLPHGQKPIPTSPNPSSHGSAVAYIIDGPADRENLP